MWRTVALTQNSIIFVHGLRGHPRETWTSSHRSDSKNAVGASSRRQQFRSIFRSSSPHPESSIHTQDGTNKRQEQVFWPQDYLAEDIPQARLWTYGYDTDVIGGLFQASGKDSVSQHGRNLAVRLEREVDNEVIVALLKDRKRCAHGNLSGSDDIRGSQPGRHSRQRRMIMAISLLPTASADFDSRPSGGPKRAASEQDWSSSWEHHIGAAEWRAGDKWH